MKFKGFGKLVTSGNRIDDFTSSMQHNGEEFSKERKYSLLRGKETE